MAGKTRKSLNSKNKIICIQCKTQVLESEEALQCDNCLKTLHFICNKLDKKQYDRLVKNPSLEYKCHFCEPAESMSVCASDLTEIKTKLNQLDEIRETMHFMSSQYDSILKGVAKNQKEIKTLKKENGTLREEVKNLKSTVKFLNDVRVQNDCIINGVKADDTDKAMDVVLKLAEKTGADICEDDVDDVYFINRHNNHYKNKGSDLKSVVVKFANKKSKRVFMQEKSKLKQNEDLKNVFINDFLSKESMELFNYAKSLKQVGFSFVYTRGGNVFVKKDSNSKQICLKSLDGVDKLLCKTAGGAKRKLLPAADNDDNNTDDDDDDEEDDDDTQFESPN